MRTGRLAWLCAAHQVWTTGDCPHCDDELLASGDDDTGEVHIGPVLNDAHCNEDACSRATHWATSRNDA
jgi:hypothetical protein